MSEQTFLFADLPGFTALAEVHGDEEAADLAGEFAPAVGWLLTAYRAEAVKEIGDAMMIRCEDAGEAIRLGLGLSTRWAAGTASRACGDAHTGSATKRGNDWFGGP
jgi:adenylate cyclase